MILSRSNTCYVNLIAVPLTFSSVNMKAAFVNLVALESSEISRDTFQVAASSNCNWAKDTLDSWYLKVSVPTVTVTSLNEISLAEQR